MGPLIAPILDFVRPSPWGFSSQGGSLPFTLTCLCTVNLKVMSGATPTFSTNRDEHCISVYITDPPSRTIPHASRGEQAMVDANLGSIEIRSRELGLSARQVHRLSTPPRWLAGGEHFPVREKSGYFEQTGTSGNFAQNNPVFIFISDFLIEIYLFE